MSDVFNRNSSNDLDLQLHGVSKPVILKKLDLCQYSIEKCEFCIKIFNNKYQTIIHNATHLTVPIWRQKFYQCPECFHVLNSLEELYDHISQMHLKQRQPQPAKEVTENQDTIENIDNDTKLNIKIERPDDVTTVESACNNNNEKHKFNPNSIINRLVFEDDIDHERDIIVPLINQNYFLLNTSNVEINMEDSVPLEEPETDRRNEVLDYDELVKPNMYSCKRCNQGFLNRYECIKHEVSHIRIKKDNVQLCIVCDKYIAGGPDTLKNHRIQKHQLTNDVPVDANNKCRKCKLIYYDYNKHLINYHKIYSCDVCDLKFTSIYQKYQHSKTHVDNELCNKCHKYIQKHDFNKHLCRVGENENKKIIEVCQVCALFYKSNSMHQYKVIGEHSVPGAGMTCECCGRKCFECLQVEREAVNTKPSNYCRPIKKKALTNVERLINIKGRQNKNE